MPFSPPPFLLPFHNPLLCKNVFVCTLGVNTLMLLVAFSSLSSSPSSSSSSVSPSSLSSSPSSLSSSPSSPPPPPPPPPPLPSCSMCAVLHQHSHGHGSGNNIRDQKMVCSSPLFHLLFLFYFYFLFLPSLLPQCLPLSLISPFSPPTPPI